MYAVAITNTAQSFITHQLAMAEPPRSLVAIVLILGLMFIVRFGQRLIMRVMSTLVYPFIISLIFMALFLIPALERRNFANRKLQRHGRWAGDSCYPCG
ncbi:serine transporter [Klebsiella pneumoniae]|uniref:Serine transporter n=1 Tax=Klebsiella pneumoniae TaxID=573 RepID=A0A447S562_KLEPN|nr:serine transporter [Klebsiella pneumoniae]